MATELTIDVSKAEGSVPVTVISFSGEIDGTNYDQMTSSAKEAIDGGARHLLLDFGGLKYMSSAGLRGIHSVYKLTNEANDAKEGEGGEYKSKYMKLVSVPDKVLGAIKATGFDLYVDILDDQAAGVAAF